MHGCSSKIVEPLTFTWDHSIEMVHVFDKHVMSDSCDSIDFMAGGSFYLDRGFVCSGMHNAYIALDKND